MSAQYATALSHAILAGAGIYCLAHTSQEYPESSFGIIAVNSIIGVWRWGNPSYGDDAARLYKFTSFLQDLLALPCIVTSVLLSYNLQMELACAHTAASIIPFVAYICDNSNSEMVDLIIGVNCISMGVVSFLHQNYYGVAASISYAFSHFIIKNDNETYFNIPSQDLYNYAMCFFTIFALKAVTLG